MKQSEKRKYARLIAILIGTWLALSTIASSLLVFKAGSQTSLYPPLPLGLAVIAPIILFGSWFGLSPTFRRFALALDHRMLTLAQTWRVGGFVFLVLYAYRILPGVFALPAGLGDLAVGATAPFVAMYLAESVHRKPYLTWQILGIFDLLMAVTLGVLSSANPIGILAHGVTTDAMSVLPLSLIPTFAVPLLTILHIICIAQALQLNEQSTTEKGSENKRVALPVAG
jgi:hypothetical protein